MAASSTFSPVAMDNQGYFRNVGRAARTLLAALLAVKSSQESAVKVAIKPSRTVSLARLYHLAGSHDSVMPNLAQELAIAARRAD